MCCADLIEGAMAAAGSSASVKKRISSGWLASAAVGARRPCREPEQLIMRSPSNAVALASDSFEAGPVSDLYPASPVLDEARLLQRACGNGDPGPAHAQHHG